ncbi:MAG: hypothetical protein AAFQ36_07520 [Pseudomonadota bacterium]
MIKNIVIAATSAAFLSACADSAGLPGPTASNGADVAIAPAGAPFPVNVEIGIGDADYVSLRPRVAVAGYNVGGYTFASATSSAGGGVFSNRGTASSTVALEANGIDEALLIRIATAAQADLIAQLTAAGFDVVPTSELQNAPNAAILELGSPSYEQDVSAVYGERTVLVAGPSGQGVQGYKKIGAANINFRTPTALSEELDAAILMPNVVFDFAATEGGRAAYARTASASADLLFTLDPNTVADLSVTENGRASFGSTYILAQPVASAEPFGTIGAVEESDNSGQQVLSGLLGATVSNRSRSAAQVSIDPAAYEALALDAARGWNAALVEEMRAGL